MTKIKRIEICGFRSFREPQALVFESNLSIVWAVNSQGKTSVAEAMEFLFTGRTTRRELLGGAKSEFERCLRNVHLDESDPVWVSADIARDDGTVAKVVRALVTDYTAERECVSKLTIDGTAAADLTSLGFVLSDPPTSAPVLLQHNLRFALSSRPQDRTDYFKAILEIGDLDPLRDLLAERLQSFERPTADVVVALRKAAAAPSVGDELGKLENGPLGTSAIESALATRSKRCSIRTPARTRRPVTSVLILVSDR